MDYTRLLNALPQAKAAYGDGSTAGPASVGSWDVTAVTKFKPETTNFQAGFFKDSTTGQYRIGFAGSNDTEDWTRANANLAVGSWTPEATDSIRFMGAALVQIRDEIRATSETPNPDISLPTLLSKIDTTVGHSQGGAWSELNRSFWGGRAVNIDGPGVGGLLKKPEFAQLKAEMQKEFPDLASEAYTANDGSLQAYAFSKIGLTGDHVGTTVQATADAKVVDFLTDLPVPPLMGQQAAIVSLHTVLTHRIDAIETQVKEGSLAEANQQIEEAFTNADKNASDIKTQYPHTTQIADASSNTNTFSNYLNTEGSNLTSAQQSALVSQINGLNLGDSKTLSFLNLPNGGTLIANADGEIVGEINRSANGQISLQSRNNNQAVSVQVFDDGSSLVSTTDAAGVVQHHVVQAPDEVPTDPAQAQPTNLTAGLSLAQAALSLQNWSQMNDLGRVTASVGLYNSLNAVNQGSLGIALGGAAGGLSLLSAFGGNGNDAQKIYTALSGVDILTSSEAIAGSGVIAESMGDAFLPGVNFAMALQSGDPTAITSSGLSLYGAMSGAAWAPQAALAIAVVSLANAALNSGETRSGGQYGWTGGEIEKLAAPSGHAIADESITPLIAGTVKSINVLLGYLGSQDKLSEFHAGLETSGNGRGGVEAGGHLSSGQTFGESGQGSNYAGTLFESTSARSLGTQEAIFNFVTDLKQATLQAIQAAPDVPSNDEVFRSVA